ncbi:MAG: transferase, partial [Candidatus Thermoplasmatota archaeon]|nr:transferase [Candidatus Thermoplasmatota archaeon]
MNRLIIYGEGNYAEQAYYYFTNDSEYEIVAFTADEAYIS